MERIRAILFSAVTIILLVPLFGCGNSAGYQSGSLRGDTILAIRLPIHNGQEELIELSRRHTVGRAFVPVKEFNQSNTVPIHDLLWGELEDLRYKWCSQLPSLPTSTSQISNDTYYAVIFQCGKISNPIYYVAPDDLPDPLSNLINSVPSTSERIIVP